MAENRRESAARNLSEQPFVHRGFLYHHATSRRVEGETGATTVAGLTLQGAAERRSPVSALTVLRGRPGVSDADSGNVRMIYTQNLDEPAWSASMVRSFAIVAYRRYRCPASEGKTLTPRTRIASAYDLSIHRLRYHQYNHLDNPGRDRARAVAAIGRLAAVRQRIAATEENGRDT